MADPVIGLAQPRFAVTSMSLHLPAAALAIIVGVLAFPVRTDRAGIVHVMAQLAHVLDHHVHAVGVPLAQMPARGVVRPPAAQPHGAVGDVVAAFALLAEPVILKLQHRGEGEGVVGAGGIDILGPARRRSATGCPWRNSRRRGRSDRPGSACPCAACCSARRCRGSAPACGAGRLRPVRPGDDDRGGVVGLHAAIQQMQRLADDAAAQHVVHRIALLVIAPSGCSKRARNGPPSPSPPVPASCRSRTCGA